MKNAILQKSVGGITANAFVRPIIIILAILHIAIIGMILQINATTGFLASTMNKAGIYTAEANSLLAGTSLLSQTANNFVLEPVTATGELNVYPLAVYAEEMKRPRRGSQVLTRFHEYDANGAAMTYLSTAAENADRMTALQLQALALINGAHPFPDSDPVNKLPLPALSAADQAMPAAQKMEKARNLLMDPDTLKDMYSVSQHVNACVRIIRADADGKRADAGRRIDRLRTGLWGATFLILLILIGMFIALYKQIFNPLKRFVRLISSNQFLNTGDGLHEVRLVASAYNNLQERRDALRSLAETDTLTSLPNRYRFEKFILDAGESGYSLAILIFDLNYLKETNDTLGHSAGDKLIQTAASCISSCFGENSFRIGGDEFAAVVKNCKPEKIQQMIHQFEEAQQRENVSISLGYAYAEEIGNTSLKQLIDEADKKMYAQKQEAHRRMAAFT